MKKRSLITKLALSGVALAATAATLATSTYAWYTSNTEVSATGMSGTAASTGDASVLISADNVDWSQSVDVATSSDSLAPLQVTAAGSFVDLDGAATENYLKVTLYVKTTATGGANTVPLYLNNLTITNKVSTAGTGVANYLKGAKNSEGEALSQAVCGGVDPSKSTYWVDAVQAVWMNFTSTSVSNANVNQYDLAACEGTQVTSTNVTTPNALTYLNAVQGTNYTKGKKGKDTGSQSDLAIATEKKLGATGSELVVANLAADGTATTLEFYFFLNGWDEYCFDACKGQSFDVTLSFTTDKALVTRKVVATE